MSERYLIVELEALLLAKGKTSADVIRATGHTPANISKIRNGKIKAIRLKTLLDICTELDCQPGDILKAVDEEQLEALVHERACTALERAKAGGASASLPEKVYVVDLSDE
ncbi:MAG: helix-turn-helix transcriptional regulator [Slackia sp.]|nr:helix-turn-helix transcriptional regulator [Slackia sp.]